MCDNCDVGMFHDRFGLDNVVYEPEGPRVIPEDLMDFRIKFMEEELKEFKDAYEAGDEAGMFDALLDLAYVVHGTSHLKGFPWHDGWQLVQRANLKKVRASGDGSDSKRGSSWDIVKPEGWTAPDIAGLLVKFGWPNAQAGTALSNSTQPSEDLEVSSGDSGLSSGV